MNLLNTFFSLPTSLRDDILQIYCKSLDDPQYILNNFSIENILSVANGVEIKVNYSKINQRCVVLIGAFDVNESNIVKIVTTPGVLDKINLFKIHDEIKAKESIKNMLNISSLEKQIDELPKPFDMDLFVESSKNFGNALDEMNIAKANIEDELNKLSFMELFLNFDKYTENLSYDSWNNIENILFKFISDWSSHGEIIVAKVANNLMLISPDEKEIFYSDNFCDKLYHYLIEYISEVRLPKFKLDDNSIVPLNNRIVNFDEFKNFVLAKKV